MSSIQGLGVELYRYVRCPTCWKTFTEDIYEGYEKATKINIQEASSRIPPGLSQRDAKNLYDKYYTQFFQETMKFLGIKRECCMITLTYPQQYAAKPPPPRGNIAITKYDIIEGTVTRKPTLIHLTRPSKVPGGSNILMMSISDDTDYMHPDYRNEFLPPQIDRPLPRIEGTPSATSESVLSKPETQILPLSFFQNEGTKIPMIETGGAVAIKRKPKIKNVEMVAAKPDYMDTETVTPTVYKNNFYEEKPDPTNDNFMDVDEMTSTLSGNLKIY